MKITKQEWKNILLSIGEAAMVAVPLLIGENVNLRQDNAELNKQVAKLEQRVDTRDPRLPILMPNQMVVFSHDYLRGYEFVGYAILTDVDYNGTWDVIEEERAGFTTGSGYKRVLFKRGFGPAQTMPQGINYEIVNEEYFQHLDKNLFIYDIPESFKK